MACNSVPVSTQNSFAGLSKRTEIIDHSTDGNCKSHTMIARRNFAIRRTFENDLVNGESAGRSRQKVPVASLEAATTPP